MTLLLSDFDYPLPSELIAQTPPEKRTDSRLLVVDRRTERLEHRSFLDLREYLGPGDVLVLNQTKVRPARLRGRKTTGARVELLLLEEVRADVWRVLCKPARRLRSGSRLVFAENLEGEVIEEGEAGERTVRLTAPGPVARAIAAAGLLALPPYITVALDEPARYQTVYASRAGSVAAPTAGLHFTAALLRQLEAAGVRVAKLALDIGLDTFRPMAVKNIEDHRMHSEAYEIPAETAEMLTKARSEGARIIAVGTTSVRALESWASAPSSRREGPGRTDLFIKPGFNFMMTDMMLTNFHLPKSTLLVMVSAFAGSELIRDAYREAIAGRYRFFSFGDAMLII